MLQNLLVIEMEVFSLGRQHQNLKCLEVQPHQTKLFPKSVQDSLMSFGRGHVVYSVLLLQNDLGFRES